MSFYSDDPVRDAERYYASQSEPEEIGRCEHCGEPIYANEDYYEIGDELLHEDCLSEWAEKFAKRCF